MSKVKRKPFKSGIHYTPVVGQKANKKVRNAKPIIVDGIQFKSTLEGYVYYRLKQLGIDVEYENNRFIILEAFKFQGETIRQMTYRPDFVTNNFIIECKGHKTDAWNVRVKLIKKMLSEQYPTKKYYTVSSMSQFEEIVEELKLE